MKAKERLGKDFSLMVILLIPVAIAINIVGAQIVAMLKLPVYLDMIGVILISIIAGPWVGVATGVLTNVVNSLVDPTWLPYAIVSGAIGFTVGYMSKKGMFLVKWKTAVAVVAIALIGTIVSTPITVIFFGGVTTSGSGLVTAAFLTAGKNIVQSVFSSYIIVETLDKAISVIIALIVIRAMPARYLVKFSYGSLYIKDKK